MDAPEQIENLFEKSRDNYMREVGAKTWTAPRLTTEESQLLLRGLDSGLLVFDEKQGRLRLAGFAPHPNTGLKSYQVFGNYQQNAYWMWREMFIQIGFGIELVLDWQWPGELIAFETKGFDVVASPENPVIMAEAKVVSEDLDEQLRVFSQNGRGGNQTDANRYAELRLYKPKMYAAVALGTRRYYVIEPFDTTLRLNRVPKPILYPRA